MRMAQARQDRQSFAANSTRREPKGPIARAIASYKVAGRTVRVGAPGHPKRMISPLVWRGASIWRHSGEMLARRQFLGWLAGLVPAAAFVRSAHAAAITE